MDGSIYARRFVWPWELKHPGNWFWHRHWAVWTGSHAVEICTYRRLFGFQWKRVRKAHGRV